MLIGIVDKLLLADDGVYDSNDIFRCVADSGIYHCIKIRKNAQVRLKTGHILRNLSALAQRNDFGRCKESVSYGERWMAETAFFSIKRSFGDTSATRFQNMVKEMVMKVCLYNVFRRLV